MRLLDFFKKKELVKEKPLSKDQRRIKANAIESHRRRISNLGEEFEQLSIKLESLEEDFSITKTEKQKESDTLIRRMTLIRYEMEIREGLVKWLS